MDQVNMAGLYHRGKISHACLPKGHGEMPIQLRVSIEHALSPTLLLVLNVIFESSIMIDDGLVGLTVTAKDDSYLSCIVQNDGVIKKHKSINIPSVHVKLPALSEKDKGFIRFAAENNLDFIAHSFVRNKEDVLAVSEILGEMNSPIKIIAKIENSQGVENIDEILDHAYGIMVARGDLAVEVPTEKIPLIQKRIIETCVERRSPVIVATQMLHTMIESPRPTRAEVSDVANACLDHADALMLSGETANGKYPEEAVRTMAKVIKEVEEQKRNPLDVAYSHENRIAAYLAKAAVKASMRLETQAIVADSQTGNSILELAAYHVEQAEGSFTERPLPTCKVNFTKRELDDFANYFQKNLLGLVYWEESRVVFMPLKFKNEHLALYNPNYNYHEKTWVAINYNGNVSVNFSKKDYLEYWEDLAFDELCNSLSDVIIDFLQLYIEGKEVRIIDKLNSMRINVFT